MNKPEKIRMKNPLVEMDGDEMTRVLWTMIKDRLLLPYVDLKTEYYDLGLPERDMTEDQITIDAANATKRLGVAVKCATITPNAQRMTEYNLKEMWKSPNATIRGILDGTVFRAPILISCIKPAVRSWKKPITIARHAYGDVYKNAELRTDEPGTAELIFTGVSGKQLKTTIAGMPGPGVLQGIHNLDGSVRGFARSCFRYAAGLRQDLWFGTKDTISKTYDGAFREIFDEVYAEFAEEFKRLGLEYFYTLIDDAVARVIRSDGGFVWACKNYDGDVMSDMVSTAFGSLSMMTSVLVSPEGSYEFEAAHGTVTRHYYRYLGGEEPTTNPIATLFAWTGALKKRGELDELPELSAFADALERSCLDTLEAGIMTKDLAAMAEGVEVKSVNTDGFISAITERLETRLW